MKQQKQIPQYIKKEFRPKSNKYCVCVFVINEGERIRNQLKKMSVYSEQIDIILADGGSTDSAFDEEYLKECGVSLLLVKTGPGKLSAQMRMALGYAIDNGYSGFIVVDGNDKDDVSSIPEFIEALNNGYDHVQGSRYVKGGQAINTPLLRHIAVKYIHAPLISLASGFRYTDTTNGFRAYSAELLNHPDILPFREIFTSYELHYYLAIRAGQLGLKVKEVPTTRKYPKNGKIPTKIGGLKGYMKILITLLNAVFNRYDP